MFIGLVYDAFRIKRKKVKSGGVITSMEDFLYWIMVSIILFCVIFVSNNGELRGYIFLGTAAGVMMYVTLLSKPVTWVSLGLMKVVARTAKILWKIGTYPLYILYRIFRVPSCFMYRAVKKGYGKAHRISKARFSFLIVRRKIFKNLRKKI